MMRNRNCGAAALAVTAILTGLLLSAAGDGCGGRAVSRRGQRVTNAEVVLVARGSLDGLLKPTG